MKRCLSFENTPKSLECVFRICLLSEWLQFEFHHSNIHFLSMVLSRLTLSHSHACQVIVWVSWRAAGNGKEMRGMVFSNLTISICFGNSSWEGSLIGWFHKS